MNETQDQTNQSTENPAPKKEKRPGFFSVPFAFFLDTCLRLGLVPPTIDGRDIPLVMRKRLQKEISKEKTLKALPQCWFICIRTGSLLSNKDMSLPHFDSKRWVPVPKSLVEKATGWGAGRRAKWAHWVLRTLLPRLKAQGKEDQLEKLAVKF